MTPKPNTQKGRILAVLSDGHWHGGYEAFGNDFHTVSQRIGELKALGYHIEARHRHGSKIAEYRWVQEAQVPIFAGVR